MQISAESSTKVFQGESGGIQGSKGCALIRLLARFLHFLLHVSNMAIGAWPVWPSDFLPSDYIFITSTFHFQGLFTG